MSAASLVSATGKKQRWARPIAAQAVGNQLATAWYNRTAIEQPLEEATWHDIVVRVGRTLV